MVYTIYIYLEADTSKQFHKSKCMYLLQFPLTIVKFVRIFSRVLVLNLCISGLIERALLEQEDLNSDVAFFYSFPPNLLATDHWLYLKLELMVRVLFTRMTTPILPKTSVFDQFFEGQDFKLIDSEKFSNA